MTAKERLTVKQRKTTALKSASRVTADTEPKFPYTTKPGSLRRMLKEIPKKPKPAKFDAGLLRAWGFSDGNDYTMLRVLKAVNLLTPQNEPTEVYTRYMSINEGGKALGPEIKRVYAPMFQASHVPYNETNETLKNLFNINSGGGDRALDLQIQTFKALCENASFDQALVGGPISSETAITQTGGDGTARPPSATGGPAININLHIHLPENKTRRDYETIIEDIGKYIFGRTTSAGHD